jgi:poly(A) polymerase
MRYKEGMSETALRRQLGELARDFGRDGYRLYVIEETARRLYRRRETPEIRLWTDADVIHLARALDDVEPAAAGRWSASAALGDHRLRLACDPLAAGVRGRGAAADPRRVAGQAWFTVHGLLYDPARDRFLDPLGCRDDVRRGVLRALAAPGPSPAARLERLLVAAALAADEPLTMDPILLEALRGDAAAPTRELLPLVRAGLEAVLTARRPMAGLELLGELGALERIIPELAALRGCPQDKEYHPEGDVWVHTLECFRRCRRLPLGLALGLLFHDIAKPPTLVVEKTVSFPGHSALGAAMAGRILRRLGYDAPLVAEVQFYVRHHLLPKLVRDLPEAELAALARHPWFENLVRIYRADVHGSQGDMARYRGMLRRLAAYRPELIRSRGKGGDRSEE